MQTTAKPVEAQQYHRPPWVSIEQASEITGLPEHVLLKHADSGWLPCIQVAGEYRVHSAKLHRYDRAPQNNSLELYAAIVKLEKSVKGFVDPSSLAERHQLPRAAIVKACVALGFELEGKRYR